MTDAESREAILGDSLLKTLVSGKDVPLVALRSEDAELCSGV